MDGQWTNQDVKRANRSRVFRYFCEAGTSSLPEAARALGMSLPTVTQNVKALTESGLLQAGGSLDSTGGRRAKAFCLCARAHLSVGLSVTAGHLGGVLLDLQGQVLHTKRERLPFAPGEAYARAAAAFLDAFLKEAGAAGAPYGLGIALPGILDRTRGLLTRSHALGLRDVPLSALTAPFAQPCLLLNDANAGAFAEASGGGLPARFFYLSLSATVGGALVENGALVEGTSFRCGEIGHMTIYPDGKPCYCGKAGCLDAYCAAKALSKKRPLAEFFAELQKGGAPEKKKWRSYVEALSIGVHNLQMLLDCPVVFGGEVGAYLPPFLPEIRAQVAARDPFADPAPLLNCRYTKEAAALGAALAERARFLSEV